MEVDSKPLSAEEKALIEIRCNTRGFTWHYGDHAVTISGKTGRCVAAMTMSSRYWHGEGYELFDRPRETMQTIAANKSEPGWTVTTMNDTGSIGLFRMDGDRAICSVGLHRDGRLIDPPVYYTKDPIELGQAHDHMRRMLARIAEVHHGS